MWRMLSAAAATALLLTGCVSNGPGTDGCEWSRPIYISRADVLTEGTAQQILEHNETGARICGW